MSNPLSELIERRSQQSDVQYVKAKAMTVDEKAWKVFFGKLNAMDSDYVAKIKEQIKLDPLSIKKHTQKDGMEIRFEYLREGKFVIEVSVFEHNEKGVTSVQYTALNNIEGRAVVREFVSAKLRAFFS